MSTLGNLRSDLGYLYPLLATEFFLGFFGQPIEFF
jgi:hypothetical protein